MVPKVKAKAAPTLAELDEWENRPTEEKRRLMQEARRVMEGNRASASAVADAIVYIPATGARFHSRPRCGNMTTPREVTRASAESMGYTRRGVAGMGQYYAQGRTRKESIAPPTPTKRNAMSRV